MVDRKQILIQLDRRHRASLGRIARHYRYLAHVESDGTIVLTPAVVVQETRAADNPKKSAA